MTTARPTGHPSSRPTSYIPMPPKRAATSFENLVALANDQERLREARKIIWRDRGDPVIHLDNLRDVLLHAIRGAIRAGSLGFGMRAGVNMFIMLFRIYGAPRKFRLAWIRHAVLGLDSFRFGAMLGTFTALYKLILNSLPIIFPPAIPARQLNRWETPTEPSTPIYDIEAGHRKEVLGKRSSRLSVRAQFLRKQSKRCHAAAAGFVAGGIAVTLESRSRRLVIAQQLFVRGLQGSYNSFTKNRGIKIPYGAVWLFSLCCGQIMYAFFLRPDTIPPSYVNWIQTASKVPKDGVSVNKSLVREATFDPSIMKTIIALKEITPLNKQELIERTRQAEVYGIFGHRFAPCETVHPWLDSCMIVPFDRFWSVFQWMLPIYGALHFIPMLLFKRSDVRKNPISMLLKAGFGTGRSSAFLGVFVVIYQTCYCLKHYLHLRLLSYKYTPKWLSDLLISKGSFWLLGFLSGLSLFVEEGRRRGELAMYVLPKGLESVWKVATGKGLVPGSQVARRSGAGEALLTAIGMAMVMSTYQMEPQHLSGLVRRILYQFIGPN